jgi:hypothetical protein
MNHKFESWIESKLNPEVTFDVVVTYRYAQAEVMTLEYPGAPESLTVESVRHNNPHLTDIDMLPLLDEREIERLTDEAWQHHKEEVEA